MLKQRACLPSRLVNRFQFVNSKTKNNSVHAHCDYRPRQQGVNSVCFVPSKSL